MDTFTQPPAGENITIPVSAHAFIPGLCVFHENGGYYRVVFTTPTSLTLKNLDINTEYYHQPAPGSIIQNAGARMTTAGEPGTKGDDGDDGLPGDPGKPGLPGPRGFQGYRGHRGYATYGGSGGCRREKCGVDAINLGLKVCSIEDHGFKPGDVLAISKNPSRQYILATALSLETAHAVGIVQCVIDEDTFVFITSGRVTFVPDEDGLPTWAPPGGFDQGDIYYLSDTPGELSTTPGVVKRAYFVSKDDHSGFWGIFSTGLEAGPPGKNAFTITNGDYQQPNVGDVVNIPTVDASFAQIGQTIYVQDGGYYDVEAVGSGGSFITGRLLDYQPHAIPGANILSGKGVSPGGAKGQKGDTGSNAYTILTTGFEQPLESGTVRIEVQEAVWAVPGQVIFVEGGGYYEVVTVDTSTEMTVLNLGYPGNESPGQTVTSPGGISPGGIIGATGEQGFNSFTELTGPFTQPNESATVEISVENTAWMVPGQIIFIDGGGYYRVDSVDSSTQATVENLGYPSNTTPGDTVSDPGGVSPAGERGGLGPRGWNSYTKTTDAFVQPAEGATVDVEVEEAAWAVPGQMVFVEGGGTYEVTSILSDTELRLENLGYVGNAGSGSTIPTGSSVGPGGEKGEQGYNSFTTTTDEFEQPGIGDTETVLVENTSWMGVGQIVYIEGGGYYKVDTINSPTSVDVENLGYLNNANVGTTVSSPALVSPSGPSGTSGISGYYLNVEEVNNTTYDVAFDISGYGVLTRIDARVAAGTCDIEYFLNSTSLGTASLSSTKTTTNLSQVVQPGDNLTAVVTNNDDAVRLAASYKFN